MSSICNAHSPEQQTRFDDFVDSATEKVFMVVGAEEIGLRQFMHRYEKAAAEKGGVLILQYNIWPREHSRHFLYRWIAETASGQACREPQAWTEFIEANPQLKSQLALLTARDQRVLEVRFLEAIRFIAEKLDAEQTLLLNIFPLAISPDPTLVDFFKSILRLLPPKTKMIINQCENDILAQQEDFCPSNRISVNGVEPGDTKTLLDRYYRCYHDNGNQGRLMRALVYMAHPLSLNELSLFTGIPEDETRAVLASSDLASMVVADGQACLRIAYPRLFFPRDETILRTLSDDMADLDQRALAYYQDRLASQPDASAAIGHSLGVFRLIGANALATQALISYRPKLALGAGEMSEMELQRALEQVDPAQDETRGRLLLAFAEVRESQGRNRDALESLEAAIGLLRKAGRRADLQTAFEFKGRAAFALREIEVAQKAFEDALRLARELKKPALIADMLSQYGYLHFSIRQLDVAEEKYQEALEQYRSLSGTNPDQSRRGMASQWSNLGHVAYARSDFEQAENYHQQAIEIYTALADEKHIAGQWGYLGHTYFAARDYIKAVNAYEQAAEHDESAGNPLMAAQRYANMGHSMYARREPDEAKRFFETALEKYKAQANASGEAAQYSNLGLVKGDQGEFDRAVEYFNQAMHIYEELGDPINAVTQMIRLGHVRRGQNDLNAAKQHYADAMERYHTLDYQLGEGDTAMELGQVNVALNEFVEADEHFHRAKAIFTKLGHLVKEAMCQMLLAQVRKAQGDMDASLSIFHEASDLYQRMGNPLGVANASFQIGLLYFDQQRYDAAERNYRDALGTFQEKEDREGEANVLANLGTLHFQTKAFNQASDELKDALSLLRKMQHPFGLAGVLVNLSFVQEAQQNYSEAHDCLKEALELYHKMKLSQEAKTIEKRLTDLERQADQSLVRMRGRCSPALRVLRPRAAKSNAMLPVPVEAEKRPRNVVMGKLLRRVACSGGVSVHAAQPRAWPTQWRQATR